MEIKNADKNQLVVQGKIERFYVVAENVVVTLLVKTGDKNCYPEILFNGREKKSWLEKFSVGDKVRITATVSSYKRKKGEKTIDCECYKATSIEFAKNPLDGKDAKPDDFVENFSVFLISGEVKSLYANGEFLSIMVLNCPGEEERNFVKLKYHANEDIIRGLFYDLKNQYIIAEGKIKTYKKRIENGTKEIHRVDNWVNKLTIV